MPEIQEANTVSTSMFLHHGRVTVSLLHGVNHLDHYLFMTGVNTHQPSVLEFHNYGSVST